MDDKIRRGLKTRVNRAAGQIAGIGRMIDEEKYCVDILHQISAARSALDSLGVQLLSAHLESCVLGHGTGTEHESAKPMSREQLLDEVKVVLTNFLK
jgi:DNA-binding FrmR family transcriptional regulator